MALLKALYTETEIMFPTCLAFPEDGKSWGGDKGLYGQYHRNQLPILNSSSCESLLHQRQQHLLTFQRAMQKSK